METKEILKKFRDKIVKIIPKEDERLLFCRISEVISLLLLEDGSQIKIEPMVEYYRLMALSSKRIALIRRVYRNHPVFVQGDFSSFFKCFRYILNVGIGKDTKALDTIHREAIESGAVERILNRSVEEASKLENAPETIDFKTVKEPKKHRLRKPENLVKKEDSSNPSRKSKRFIDE
eukprot:GHVP01032591.1.p1 GENE.GHVP01032591.1~~GHVP01032591.1.p1  ORF type:complete len:177 (-),score=33.24 GHVP01032591.1:323-853(-)